MRARASSNGEGIQSRGMLLGVKAPVSQPQIISPEQVNGWFALLFTHATVTGRIDAVLTEQHKISFSSVEILCWLLDTEPQSVRSLAGKLCKASALPEHHGWSRTSSTRDISSATPTKATDGESLISFTKSGRHFAETIKGTFEGSVKKYFVDPLDDDDIAAITRIWARLEKQ